MPRAAADLQGGAGRSLACSLLAAAALASGCGDEAPSPAPTGTTFQERELPPLTASELELLRRTERLVDRYCARWSAFRLGEVPPPSDAQRERVEASIDRLLEVVERKANAEVGRSSELRLEVGGIAESVEGSNCDRRIELRVAEGLNEAVAVYNARQR